MYSEPYVIGTKAADGNGGVSFTWTLPTATESGPHRVVLVGAQSGSAERSFPVAADGSLAKTGAPVAANLGVIGLVCLLLGGTAVLAAARPVRRTD